MSEIFSEKVEGFLKEMLPERDEFLQELEKTCQNEFIPLVEPEVGRFLQVLLSLKGARSVLEVGTALGYSGILLARAPGERHITTIEIDEDRYQRACENFRGAGVSHLITPLLGDANEVIPTLEGPFDFIFVDAAKGQYPQFFARVMPLLLPGGVLVIDNVFLNGWVIDMTWPERRKKTMVCRVRELLEVLKNHEELITSVIPLGDGLTVSVRRT